MVDIYLAQLVGILMTAAGMVALTVSAYLYGTPLPREETRQRGRDKDNGNRVRLPIRLETVTSTLVLLGGIGILSWSKFDLCPFLNHWVPDLPHALLLMLRCG